MYCHKTDIKVGEGLYVAQSAIYNEKLNRRSCEILTLINRSVPEFKKILTLPNDLTFRVAPLKARSLRGRYYDRNRFIEIDCRLVWDVALETIAHELVHAEQYMTGRLSKEWSDKHRNWLHLWNGELNKNRGTTYNAYRNMPWEEEAFGRQAELASIVYENLKKTYEKPYR